MAGLYLFAEGQTEQTFAHAVLSPHLAHYGLVVEKIVLVAKKRGGGHRGGGSRYLPMKNDIVRFLKQVKRADVFFTTMIDLFRIYPDFPGLKEAEKLGFKRAYTPTKTSAFKGLTLPIKPVETVSALARELFGAANRKKAVSA